MSEYRQMDWRPERIGRFWAWQSRFPGQYFTYQFGDTIARRLKPWLAGRKRILDYGCGTGFLLPHLAALGAGHVVGADLSPESVARANARHGGVRGFAGAFTIAELRRRGETFDAVTVIEVVEHLDDAAFDAVMDDLRSLLAPDGVAIVTTPNQEDLQASETYCPCCDHIFHRYQHVRSWTPSALRERLEAAGLAVERTIETDLSAPGPRRPLAFGLRLVTRLRGGRMRQPHLVCITRMRA